MDSHVLDYIGKLMGDTTDCASISAFKCRGCGRIQCVENDTIEPEIIIDCLEESFGWRCNEEMDFFCPDCVRARKHVTHQHK